jgi:transposase
MADLIVSLYEDWLWLDERIESVTAEIEAIARSQANCQRLMSVPGVGPMISTAMVAAIGDGEAFDRGRDFGTWLGLVPRQHSTGGRPILGRISKRGTDTSAPCSSRPQRCSSCARTTGNASASAHG